MNISIYRFGFVRSLSEEDRTFVVLGQTTGRLLHSETNGGALFSVFTFHFELLSWTLTIWVFGETRLNLLDEAE